MCYSLDHTYSALQAYTQLSIQTAVCSTLSYC